MTLQQFIDRHNLTLTATRADRNPDMSDFDGDHWKVTLKRPRRQMALVFSKGYGHGGAPPTAEEVLECLACDAWADFDDFEGFCSEYGYDSDSRKAERLFKSLARQSRKLKKFMGPGLFDELMSCEE